MSHTSPSTQPPVSHPRAASGPFQCPTCKAAWRNTVTCQRCGTELTSLMQAAVHAWTLRQAARAALCERHCPAEALALARASCRFHNTPQGQRLVALALLAHDKGSRASTALAQLLAEA